MPSPKNSKRIDRQLENDIKANGRTRVSNLSLPDGKLREISTLIAESGIIKQLAHHLELIICNYIDRREGRSLAPYGNKERSNLSSLISTAAKFYCCQEGDIARHRKKIADLLDRPGTMTRLAGAYDLALAKNGDTTALRKFRDRLVANPHLTIGLANLCLARGVGYRNKKTPGLQTNNPVQLDFTCSLVEFWQRRLGRLVTKTGNADDDSSSDAILFVQKCFELAGEYCTLSACRARVSQAQKQLQAGDALEN